MATMTVEISTEAIAAMWQSPEEFVREMRLAAAMYWYARGRISQERAAEIAGLSRTDFLLALARERVPAFAVEIDQLREEINRA